MNLGLSEPEASAATAAGPNLFYLARVALVASAGGFLFGYDLVIIAGALPFLERAFGLSSWMAGWAVSSAILGAIAGPLLGLWFEDLLGRKRIMMVAAIALLASSAGCAFAGSIQSFAAARFVGGMGVGLAMISSPIYIAELSPPATRGGLVNVNQLSNVIGINLAVLVSYAFADRPDGWRWMFGSQGLPALLLLLGLFLVPESPRWLVARGRARQARTVLARVNGAEVAERELAAIKADITAQSGGFADLLEPGVRTALWIGIVLMVFSQINGVNMLLLYAPRILADVGVSFGSQAILSSVPVYLLVLACTLAAFPLIRRFSRRGLLIASAIGMAGGHLLMAAMLIARAPPLSLLVPMMLGTGSFTLGLAPLSWVIVAEIFPNRTRGKALAVVCAFLFASSFATAQAFPILLDLFTRASGSSAGVYMLFALVCLACAWFGWRLLPETKGLSLEQIGAFWRDRGRTRARSDRAGRAGA